MILFLDYDGTLVSIKKTPMEAKAPSRAISLLNDIADNDNIAVTIVSGRKIEDLLYFLVEAKLSKINIVGGHGAQYKKAGCDVEINQKAKELIDEIGKIKKRIGDSLKDKDCLYIEDKKISFSIHYRKCRKKDMPFIEEVVNELDNQIKGKPLEIMKGKKVIEIKPKGIDKSIAIEMFAKDGKQDSLVICIGDDLTDEFLFKKNKNGINVKVKSSEDFFDTSAKYYLKNVTDVHAFLKNLNELVSS